MSQQYRACRQLLLPFLYLLLGGLFCFIQPQNFDYHFNDIINASFLPPFTEGHLLGTDEIGRDIYLRLLIGGQNALVFSFIAVSTAAFVGITIESLAGYFGGWVDAVCSKIIEFFLVVPTLLLALVTLTLFGTHLYIVAVTIGLVSWTSEARISRAEFYKIKSMDFVKLSQVAKTPTWKILLLNILPNALPPLIVSVSITMGASLLLEAALSFLGLTDLENVSWGLMAGEGQGSLLFAPWVALIPTFMIFLTVFMITMLSDGLNTFLNPKE